MESLCRYLSTSVIELCGRISVISSVDGSKLKTIVLHQAMSIMFSEINMHCLQGYPEGLGRNLGFKGFPNLTSYYCNIPDENEMSWVGPVTSERRP